MGMEEILEEETIKFRKGTGRYYFECYYRMYPMKYIDGKVDMEQMKKDELDFIGRVEREEIKFDSDGNFIGTNMKTKRWIDKHDIFKDLKKQEPKKLDKETDIMENIFGG